MEPPISSDARQAALLAAAKSGDLKAVQAHFQLPEVLENVAAWNTEHRAQRLGHRIQGPHQHRNFLPKPWFNGVDRGKMLFATNIVYHEQVEVFRWFFSPSQIDMMEDSLRVMAPQIACACLFAQIASSFAMVEIVFESRLFTEIMGDEERRSLLGGLLCTAASRGFHEWVSVLVAHGADPNEKRGHETPIMAMAREGNMDTLDALLVHGACLEGEESALILSVVERNERLVAALLRRGADANFVSGEYVSALSLAANMLVPTVVARLALEGFADVDKRGESGCTPLMIVAWGSHWHRNVQSKLQVVELLLECGADVHAVDIKQRGMLHYVLRDQNQNIECVRLFLEQGLDPNQQDATGLTPLCAMLLHARHGIRERTADLLDLMLQAGADPYVLDHDGLSATQVLESTESGRAYVAARRQFFRQHPRPLGSEPMQD